MVYSQIYSEVYDSLPYHILHPYQVGNLTNHLFPAFQKNNERI